MHLNKSVYIQKNAASLLFLYLLILKKRFVIAISAYYKNYDVQYLKYKC